MNITQKKRRIILTAAAVILLLCVIWLFTRGRSSERSRICAFLSDYGYECYEDDLLFAYDEKNTSIRAALSMTDAELEDALTASKAGGFPSDAEKIGGVTLVLAKCGDDTVCMYMLDGEFELVFVQDGIGSIKAIGNRD